MKINLDRQTFFTILNSASKFSSTKTIVSPILQGCLLIFDKQNLHVYATNLNVFYHTSTPAKTDEELKVVIEAKKIVEFLGFLSETTITLDFGKSLIISSKKVKGTFPLMEAQDFPLPPKLKEKSIKVPADFFVKHVPFVQFAAAHDETRPAFTAIYLAPREDKNIMVATDGFRLSLVRVEEPLTKTPLLIPASFLAEVSRFVKKEEVLMTTSSEEKIVHFMVGDQEFYSRLIDADFPPFERVVPTSTTTTVVVEKEELIRNIKLVSIFAREVSNIVILETQKGELFIHPKIDEGDTSGATVEAKVEGEPIRIAFNYKFLLEFLQTASSKNIVIELLRSDAPAVLKEERNQNALHIIMPVRIQV